MAIITDDNWDDWDRVTINGVLFDETTVDVDFEIGNDFDIQKAPGADGAPARNKGYSPCQPKLTWTLWTAEHRAAYRGLIAVVQPKPGKTPPSVVIVRHPQLTMHRKEKFTVAKIHSLKKIGPQMQQAQFDLIEYFPAPLAAAVAFDGSPDRKDQNGVIVRHDNYGLSDADLKRRENAKPSKSGVKP